MSFLGTMWLGTGNAALTSVIHPSVRATSYSVLLLVASLIGLGGWASAALGERYGETSIRDALMLAASAQLLGGLFHYLASRRYAQNAEANRRANNTDLPN